MKKYFNWRNLAIAMVAIASFVLAAPNMAVAEEADEIVAESQVSELSAEEIQLVESAADEGDVEAQLVIGAIYYSGNGTSKDYVKARKYLEMAVQQGNVEAMVILSSIYAQGLGVDQDVEKSMQLLIEAANNGNKEAIEALQVLKNMSEDGADDSDADEDEE